MDDDVATPAASGTTDQTLTSQMTLKKGDSVYMSGGTCGANVNVQDASFALERIGA
jgi:hypothetical protein